MNFMWLPVLASPVLAWSAMALGLRLSLSLASREDDQEDFAGKVSAMLDTLSLKCLKVKDPATWKALAISVLLLGGGLAAIASSYGRASALAFCLAVAAVFTAFVISLVDHMTGLIPDSLSIVICGLLGALVSEANSWQFWLVNLVGGLLAVAVIWHLAKRGLAFGDAKLAAMVAIGGGCGMMGAAFLAAFLTRLAMKAVEKTEGDEPLGFAFYIGMCAALALAPYMGWYSVPA